MSDSLDKSLLSAASKDAASTVFALLERGAKVDAVNENGSTSLMIASFYGNAAVQSALIQGGANVEATNSKGKSALMFAAGAGRATAVAAEDVVEAPWRLHPEHPAASHPKVAAIFQYLNQHPLVVGGQPMVSSMCLLP